jgi:hypothetical protein
MRDDQSADGIDGTPAGDDDQQDLDDPEASKIDALLDELDDLVEHGRQRCGA